MQMRCSKCPGWTVWVCSTCSTDPQNLVPLCPAYTIPRKGDKKGQKIFHSCQAEHRCNPTFCPKGKMSGAHKRSRCDRSKAPEVEEDEMCMDVDE
eukprot:4639370-Prymnesium_polylepis.2